MGCVQSEILIFGSRQNFANFFCHQNFVRDSMAGQNYSPRLHMGSPHMETCRPTKEFPFGDSLLPNRVCAHLGINIYEFIHTKSYKKINLHINYISPYGHGQIPKFWHLRPRKKTRFARLTVLVPHICTYVGCTRTAK
jgi:hypothetical protein